MSIGNRVKALRSELKMTQLEFGRRIGTSGATISTTESGKTTPDNQTILLICREFGVRREWLELGHEPMYAKEAASEPEALVPDLLAILSDHPSVLNLLQRMISHMTPADWDRLNALIDDILVTAKKDPEA